MTTRSRSSASWERVLAAMEADAARAAALLVSDDASTAAGIEYDGQDSAPGSASPADEPTSVPATWRLPVAAGISASAAGGPALTGGAAARAVAGYAAAASNFAVRAGSPKSSAHIGETSDGVAEKPGSDNGTGSDTVPGGDSVPDLETAPDAFELPDLADMPPMDPEQRERFVALHARITALQAELSAAMAEAETVLARPTPRRTEQEPRPELVDRRL